MNKRDGSPFRELLQQQIAERRLSQTKLAKASGIPRETIRSWLKRGTTPKKWEQVMLLAIALKLDATAADQLLGTAGHPSFPTLQKLAQEEMQKSSRLGDKIREFDYQTFNEQIKRWLTSQHYRTYLADDTNSSQPHAPQIWGDFPNRVSTFCGRDAELTTLQQLFDGHTTNMIVVVGGGGMGKTTLVSQFLHTIIDQSAENHDENYNKNHADEYGNEHADEYGNEHSVQPTRESASCTFDAIIWTSLVNATPLETMLDGWLQALSGQDVLYIPSGVDAQLTLLLKYLNQQRVLLVLDNFESILEDGPTAGGYRSEFGDYARLIDLLGRSIHQSTLIVTTREVPLEVERLEQDFRSVVVMHLSGLSLPAAHQLLTKTGVGASAEELTVVAERYSGNPLGLKLSAQVILDLYSGKTDDFLSEETVLFDDIFRVLSQQFERLSALEKELLIWLAIERLPVTYTHLQKQLALPPRPRLLIEAMRSLQRRSLIESRAAQPNSLASPSQFDGITFFLQNVVLEFVTEKWIELAMEELISGNFGYLYRHPLLLAQTPNYLQDVQRRLILQPLTTHLQNAIGTRQWRDWAMQRIATIRAEKGVAPNYAAGNILNLLLHAGVDVGGLDFSNLAVWQAAGQDQPLQQIDFSGADLKNMSFTDTFSIIRSLAYSPNGRFLAAGSSGGSIRIWLAITMQPVAIIAGHVGLVRTLCFSSNGLKLASGGEDGMVYLWDLTPIVEPDVYAHPLVQLEMIGQFSHYSHPVSRLNFSTEGDTLFTASFDGLIRSWPLDQIATTQAPSEPPVTGPIFGHEGQPVRAMAAHPSAQLLVSGSDDGMIRLWDRERGVCLQEINAQTDHVYALEFSPDGTFMVSALADQTIQLWQVDTEFDSGKFKLRPYKTLQGHKQPIRNFVFSPNNDALVSCGDDEVILIWDLKEGRIVQRLQGHSGWVEALAFSATGTIASAGADNTLRLWERATGTLLRQLHGYSISVMSIAMAPSGTRWISGDHTVRLWDQAADTLCKQLDGHDSFIWQVAYSADGRHCVSASDDGTICIWNAENGNLLRKIRHDAAVCAVTFHPTQPLIVSSDYAQTITLWEMDSGKRLKTFGGVNRLTWQLAFDPTGTVLAAGCEDHCIYIWTVEDAQLQQVLTGHENAVRAVTISPDKAILASGSYDRTIRIWNLSSGQELQALIGHQGPIQSLAFSPTGDLLASASSDCSIRLWDTASRTLVGRVPAHNEQIRTIDFRADGKVLISGGDDGVIKLWDVHSILEASGKTVRSLQTLSAPGPYTGMKIAGVQGITAAQQEALKALGAVAE